MALTGTYVEDAPQGTQQINNTQQPINTNFQDISNLIGINHINFNTADTFGQHNLLTYYEQDSDPTTAASEMALYSKKVSSSNGAELFYRYPNNGSVIQLTGKSTTTSTGSYATGNQFINLNINGFVYPALGYQYLSNGLLMKWGTYWIYPTTTAFATYSIPIPTNSQIPPFTTAIYNIQCVNNNDGGGNGYRGSTGNQGLVYVTPISISSFSAGIVGRVYSGTTYWAIIANWTIIGV